MTEILIIFSLLLFALSFVTNIFLIKVAKDDKVSIDYYTKNADKLKNSIIVLYKQCDVNIAKIKNLKSEVDNLNNQLNIKYRLCKKTN